MRHTPKHIVALIAGLGLTLIGTTQVLGGSIANLTVINLSPPDMVTNTSLYGLERRRSAPLLWSNATATAPTCWAQTARRHAAAHAEVVAGQ